MNKVVHFEIPYDDQSRAQKVLRGCVWVADYKVSGDGLSFGNDYSK